MLRAINPGNPQPQQAIPNQPIPPPNPALRRNRPNSDEEPVAGPSNHPFTCSKDPTISLTTDVPLQQRPKRTAALPERLRDNTYGFRRPVEIERDLNRQTKQSDRIKRTKNVEPQEALVKDPQKILPTNPAVEKEESTPEPQTTLMTMMKKTFQETLPSII
jgi:hypothetical protein